MYSLLLLHTVAVFRTVLYSTYRTDVLHQRHRPGLTKSLAMIRRANGIASVSMPVWPGPAALAGSGLRSCATASGFHHRWTILPMPINIPPAEDIATASLALPPPRMAHCYASRNGGSASFLSLATKLTSRLLW